MGEWQEVMTRGDLMLAACGGPTTFLPSTKFRSADRRAQYAVKP